MEALTWIVCITLAIVLAATDFWLELKYRDPNEKGFPLWFFIFGHGFWLFFTNNRKGNQ